MERFLVEWEYTVEAVVEAESREAAEAAAREHIDERRLHEWADMDNSDDWSVSVSRTKAAPDMGVIKNDNGEWEAVHIMDAEARWAAERIKGYAKVRCPECGEEGEGRDFFVHPFRMECPGCCLACDLEEPPGPFIVDPGPAEPQPDDLPLPFGEEEQS